VPGDTEDRRLGRNESLDIQEAESEIDKGDVVTADELRAKYLAK
jgi:hypothetical protein